MTMLVQLALRFTYAVFASHNKFCCVNEQHHDQMHLELCMRIAWEIVCKYSLQMRQPFGRIIGMDVNNSSQLSVDNQSLH